jgi:hypothetical protein
VVAEVEAAAEVVAAVALAAVALAAEEVMGYRPSSTA